LNAPLITNKSPSRLRRRLENMVAAKFALCGNNAIYVSCARVSLNFPFARFTTLGQQKLMLGGPRSDEL
jgi:hypothetical protein